MCLLSIFVAAPGAEASCHFCLENTVEACSSLEYVGCRDNATYMATHLPSHLLEPACATVDC